MSDNTNIVTRTVTTTLFKRISIQRWRPQSLQQRYEQDRTCILINSDRFGNGATNQGIFEFLQLHHNSPKQREERRKEQQQRVTQREQFRSATATNTVMNPSNHPTTNRLTQTHPPLTASSRLVSGSSGPQSTTSIQPSKRPALMPSSPHQPTTPFTQPPMKGQWMADAYIPHPSPPFLFESPASSTSTILSPIPRGNLVGPNRPIPKSTLVANDEDPFWREDMAKQNSQAAAISPPASACVSVSPSPAPPIVAPRQRVSALPSVDTTLTRQQSSVHPKYIPSHNFNDEQEEEKKHNGQSQLIQPLQPLSATTPHQSSQTKVLSNTLPLPLPSTPLIESTLGFSPPQSSMNEAVTATPSAHTDSPTPTSASVPAPSSLAAPNPIEPELSIIEEQQLGGPDQAGQDGLHGQERTDVVEIDDGGDGAQPPGTGGADQQIASDGQQREGATDGQQGEGATVMEERIMMSPQPNSIVDGEGYYFVTDQVNPNWLLDFLRRHNYRPWIEESENTLLAVKNTLVDLTRTLTKSNQALNTVLDSQKFLIENFVKDRPVEQVVPASVSSLPQLPLQPQPQPSVASSRCHDPPKSLRGSASTTASRTAIDLTASISTPSSRPPPADSIFVSSNSTTSSDITGDSSPGKRFHPCTAEGVSRICLANHVVDKTHTRQYE